jgi:PAS domain S-box-containing protein
MGYPHSLMVCEQGNLAFITVNDAATRQYGYSKDEFLALNFEDLFPREDLQQFLKSLLNIQPGNNKIIQSKHQNKSGVIFDIELTIQSSEFNGKEAYLFTAVDKSKRKSTEELIKTSEENFRTIFEEGKFGIVLVDANFAYIQVNPAFASMVGYSVEELISNSYTNLTHPDDLPENQRNAEALWRGEIPYYKTEKRYIRKDGRGVWAYIAVSLIRDNEGMPRYYLTIIEDITERKRAAEAFKEKTKELEGYFNSSLDLLCIADTDGNFLRLNPEWEHVLGYPVEELEGKRFLDFVHPQDLDPTLQAISVLSSQEKILNFTNRYRSRDGTYKWIEWRARPQGSLIYAVARDITERKQAEKSSQESETNLQAILGSTNDIIASYDRDIRLVVYNKACSEVYRQLFGIEIYPGLRTLDLFPEAQRDFWVTNNARALAGEMFSAEFSLPGAGGELQFFESFYNPIRQGNEITGFSTFTRNITNRRQAEHALKESEFLLAKSQSVGQIGSYYFTIGSGKWISSKAMDDIFGIGSNYSRDINGWISLVHPEEKEIMLAYLSHYVIEQHNRFDYEYRIIRENDKQERWVHGLGELEFDKDGNPVKMIGTIQDITAQKAIEAALLETNVTFFTLIQSAAVAIFLLDLEGRVKLWNPAAERMFGWKESEVLGPRSPISKNPRKKNTCQSSTESNRGKRLPMLK